MTLGQAFTWAIELEAGYQLSEGVSLARPPEIMQTSRLSGTDKAVDIYLRLESQEEQYSTKFVKFMLFTSKNLQVLNLKLHL